MASDWLGFLVVAGPLIVLVLYMGIGWFLDAWFMDTRSRRHD